MKFIHTGDIHLGCIPDAGASWSKKRSTDIWRTFEDIARLAGKNNIELLLICGDLFHRQPLLKELKEVNHILSSAKHTQIVITAGNHDYMIPGSPYYSFNWSDNIHFLRAESMESVEFPKLNTVVHGFSYYSNELTSIAGSDITQNIICPDDGKKHILMLHGGDAKHLPLNYESLRKSGFDYIALGHIHKPELFENSAMAYCGSPEPLDRTEKGPHGCILVTLEDSAPEFNRRFIPTARSLYISCKIKITPDTTVASLRNTISHIINEKGCDNIFSIIFFGSRHSELDINLHDYSDLGNIIEIIDNSTPDYDIEALSIRHKDDIIDKFINSLTSGCNDTSNLSGTKRNALYYGLDALLDSIVKNGGAK